MNVIVWAKQGGRRYTQWSSPSIASTGMLWTSIGQAADVVSTGGMIMRALSWRRRWLAA